MQTASGRAYWPLDPRADEVFIGDIAHALSNLCRYGGHCRKFYSVAEHSVLVSQVVPPEDALAGLLHDAAEAYCIDVPRPLKGYLAGYEDIEHRNWRAICQRFGLPVELPASVKLADNAVLLAEKAALMLPQPMPWNVPGTAAPVLVEGYTPADARYLFLDRFDTLYRSARHGVHA
jgi:hypothetical protein